jgi:uncharacterized protein (UPF0333 family)
MKKRGQVSTEYLMITGIMLLFLIFVIAFSTDRTTNTLKINKIAESLEVIKVSIERVYSLGVYNREVVLIDLPKGINNITIIDKEIIFNTEVFGEYSDFHFAVLADVNLTGTIGKQPGRHYVKIEMINETHVNITG